MPNDFFRFKKFTVKHDKCAMKVGTDGVLIGCIANGEKAKTALDVGTGTGLISLMLAQRFPQLSITAIDIDEDAILQATDNVRNSEWSDRIIVERMDYSHIECYDIKYDLIISNPPFYEEDISCPNKKRDTARHTDSLPFQTLIENSSKLLNSNGLFTVIIPNVKASDFVLDCAMNGLHLSRRIDIKTLPRKEAKRVILEFSKTRTDSARSTLLLRDETGEYSSEYKELTKDFYL